MAGRIRARPALLYAAAESDVPARTDNATLWFVDTDPPQLWLTYSGGKSQLGWSGHASSSSDLTLSTSPQDVPGCSLTLPTVGTYIVIGTFLFQNDSGTAPALIGQLTDANNNAQSAVAWFDVALASAEATVVQVWAITTTSADEVWKLRAYKLAAVGVGKVLGTSTTISASAFLGGEQGAASGAPDDADYLVGTAHPDLSAEIVVGTTPGGELGGTWGSPTVDATHSGSAHHDPVAVDEEGVEKVAASDTMDFLRGFDVEETPAGTAAVRLDHSEVVSGAWQVRDGPGPPTYELWANEETFADADLWFDEDSGELVVSTSAP